MANPNFRLQYPHLIRDNYETWCIRVKTWLDSQDVWERVKKGFEEPIEEATLISTQRKAVQKA